MITQEDVTGASQGTLWMSSTFIETAGYTTLINTGYALFPEEAQAFYAPYYWLSLGGGFLRLRREVEPPGRSRRQRRVGDQPVHVAGVGDQPLGGPGVGQVGDDHLVSLRAAGQ